MGLVQLKQIEPFGTNSAIDIDYASLLALVNAQATEDGQWYFITDRNVWVQALHSHGNNGVQSGIALQGYYQRHCLDFQNTSGSFLGIWYDGIGGLGVGKLVGWDDLHWTNLTGVDTASNPSADGTNWKIIGTNNHLGSWNALLTPVVGDTVIHVVAPFVYTDNYYVNLTGVNTATAPHLDPTNWQRITSINKISPTGMIGVGSVPNRFNGYTTEVYYCEFDIWNDWIQRVKDHRGNEIGSSYIATYLKPNRVEIFQWGRDETMGNICFGNSQMDIVNAVGIYAGNNLTDSEIVSSITFTRPDQYVQNNTLISSAINNISIETTGANGITNNVLISSSITHKTLTLTGKIQSWTLNRFAYTGVETIETNSVYGTGSKNVELGNSSVETTLDMDDGAIYDGGTDTLTIPAYMTHVGTFILDGASSNYPVSKIVNCPTSFPVVFKTVNGVEIDFTPTQPLVAVAGNIINGNITKIIGRTNGTDSFTVRREGTFVVHLHDTTHPFTHASYKTTSSVTLANSVAETDMLNAGSYKGTKTIPANMLNVGDQFTVKIKGYCSTNGSPTVRLRIRLGGIAGTVIADTTAQVIGPNISNNSWTCEATFTIRSIGGVGTVIGQGYGVFFITSNTNDHLDLVSTAPVTIDTTTALEIVLSAQWGTADPGNSLVSTNCSIEFA